jgi:hypothetical protein
MNVVSRDRVVPTISVSVSFRKEHHILDRKNLTASVRLPSGSRIKAAYFV